MGGTIHDPAFHDRLNHMMNHRPLQDGLYDLSLNNAALNNGTNDVPLDNPPLDARLVVGILHHKSCGEQVDIQNLIIVTNSSQLPDGPGLASPATTRPRRRRRLPDLRLQRYTPPSVRARFNPSLTGAQLLGCLRPCSGDTTATCFPDDVSQT